MAQTGDPTGTGKGGKSIYGSVNFAFVKFTVSFFLKIFLFS